MRGVRRHGRPGFRSKYKAHEDQRDEMRGIREVVLDEFSKLFRKL